MKRTAARLSAWILCAAAGGALAQAYPVKPVRMLVPFAAGGAVDIVGRAMAQVLSTSMGQSFVVENRPGAGGSIGADAVAKAAPDGQTLLLASGGAISIAPHLNPRLPYDAKKDFAAVALVGDTPMTIAVRADSPYKALADVLRDARARPGALAYASTGNATVSHLTGELLAQSAGIRLLHVPYKGAAPGVADVAGGQVQAMIINIPSVMPLVKAGKLKALAATSAKRPVSLPEVPTLAESGVAGYETLAWFGLLAPAKTAPSTVERLHAELRKALAREDLRETLSRSGAEASGIGPADFLTFIKSEIAKYGKVIRDAGIRVE